MALWNGSADCTAQVGEDVKIACFGVAGPVVGQHAKITNLSWVVNAPPLGSALRFDRVRLLKDLEAIANAVPILLPNDQSPLNDKPLAAGGTIGVVAPGTGLAEAFLTWNGATYRAFPSEGGHGSFAPRTPLAVDLLANGGIYLGGGMPPRILPILRQGGACKRTSTRGVSSPWSPRCPSM